MTSPYSQGCQKSGSWQKDGSGNSEEHPNFIQIEHLPQTNLGLSCL